jgi:hypothetical protein
VTTTRDTTHRGARGKTANAYVFETEKIGAEAYDDGSRPHQGPREGLHPAENELTEVTPRPKQDETVTGEKPLNPVRAGGGNTQGEKRRPGLAPKEGDHPTYNEVYAANDLEMAPQTDRGIVDAEARKAKGNNGFDAGDTQDLEGEIAKNGAEEDSEGGSSDSEHPSNGEEIHRGGIAINQLTGGGTQSNTAKADTSDITQAPSGTSATRARRSGRSGERVSSNDYLDGLALHDNPPVPNRPVAVAESSGERGTPIQFESTARPERMGRRKCQQ